MTAARAFRTLPAVVDLRTWAALEAAAERRKTTAVDIAERLLAVIAADDIVDAVLDDSGQDAAP